MTTILSQANQPLTMILENLERSNTCKRSRNGLNLGRIMDPLVEEFRRRAAYCEEMADSAASQEIRAEWLRLAGHWLAMLPYEDTTLQDKIDAVMQEGGARPEDSRSSRSS